MAKICPFKMLGLPLSASLEEIDERCEQLLVEYHLVSDMTEKLRSARMEAVSMRCTVACSEAKEWRLDEEIKLLKSLPEDRRAFMAETHTILAKRHSALARRYRLRFASESFYFVDSRLWKPEHEREADQMLQYGMGDSRLKLLEERASKWEARREAADVRHYAQALHAQLVEAGLQLPSILSAATEEVPAVKETAACIEDLRCKLTCAKNENAVFKQAVGILNLEKEVWVQKKVAMEAMIHSLNVSLNARDTDQFLKDFKERQKQRAQETHGPEAAAVRAAVAAAAKAASSADHGKPPVNLSARDLNENLVNFADAIKPFQQRIKADYDTKGYRKKLLDDSVLHFDGASKTVRHQLLFQTGEGVDLRQVERRRNMLYDPRVAKALGDFADMSSDVDPMMVMEMVLDEGDRKAEADDAIMQDLIARANVVINDPVTSGNVCQLLVAMVAHHTAVVRSQADCCAQGGSMFIDSCAAALTQPQHPARPAPPPQSAPAAQHTPGGLQLV